MTVIIIFQTDTALGCVTVRRRISAHLSAFARSSALGLRCPFANKRRTVDRTYGQRNSEIGRMNKRVARIEMDFYYYTVCRRDVVSLCIWSPRRDVWYISHAELRYMVIIIFKIHRACTPAGRGRFIIIINIFFRRYYCTIVGECASTVCLKRLCTTKKKKISYTFQTHRI